MMVAFIIARIAAAIMLFLALGRLPYGYYTLLRFVVCCTTAYGAYFTSTGQKAGLGVDIWYLSPYCSTHLYRFISLVTSGLTLISAQNDLELLKGTFPKLSRVAVLSHGALGGDREELQEIQTAARTLGV